MKEVRIKLIGKRHYALYVNGCFVAKDLTLEQIIDYLKEMEALRCMESSMS